MKTAMVALMLAAGGLAFAPEAKAQAWVMTHPWAGIWTTGPGSTTPLNYVVPSYGTVTYSSGYSVPTYSYYASYPYPARQYVGFGQNDFPFYGKPYGRPYDPWTWSAMNEDPYESLARYYYPPVR